MKISVLASCSAFLLTTALTANAAPGNQNAQPSLDSQQVSQPKDVSKPNMDDVSYAIGYNIGEGLKRLKSQGVDINSDQVAAGMKANVSGSDSKMSEEKRTKLLEQFRTYMQAQAQKKAASQLGGSDQ